jgi:hypothetical protein
MCGHGFRATANLDLIDTEALHGRINTETERLLRNELVSESIDGAFAQCHALREFPDRTPRLQRAKQECLGWKRQAMPVCHSGNRQGRNEFYPACSEPTRNFYPYAPRRCSILGVRELNPS